MRTMEDMPTLTREQLEYRVTWWEEEWLTSLLHLNRARRELDRAREQLEEWEVSAE